MECAKDKFEDTKQIKFDCLILFQTQIWKSENKTSIIVKTAETKFNRTIEFLFSFAPKSFHLYTIELINWFLKY